MPGFAQPEDRSEERTKDWSEDRSNHPPPTSRQQAPPGSGQSSLPAGFETFDDASGAARTLEESELDSALQLLVERAQYITGATGAALALPHGDEMVCRASAGSCAPAVGARLQVRSGLTGESMTRRQLLRCDNAESDPRVNLEACRALGIASIVVLPLLRRSGEVRGLFELFSDHAYAFEERDLIALERMADLSLTALDLAEKRQNPAPRRDVAQPAELFANFATAGAAGSGDAVAPAPPPPETAGVIPAWWRETSSSSSPSPLSSAAPASPEAVRVQKCASCGFPVSEGRTRCLDCENAEIEKRDRLRNRPNRQDDLATLEQAQDANAASPRMEEIVPGFLTGGGPEKQSWLANHVNLLAIMVLILGILVAVVVFRVR